MVERDGLLVVDKAAGMTSFDVVRQVRRLAKMRKVGHTGTLDPDATGLLAVALGGCTKLAKYLILDEKEYAFQMRFGAATDTDDSSGEVVREAEFAHIEEEAIRAVLPRFRGEIDQVPPVYSALKIDGKRAYARARAGEDVEMAPRKVQIYELELTRWQAPDAELVVRCGSGTYVRSLARDIGEALESAAHTTMIRRLRVGPFDLRQAVLLEDLTPETFWSHVLSPLEMVQSLEQVELDEAMSARLRQGQPIRVAGGWAAGAPLAAHVGGQQLVAIVECKRQVDGICELWPRRVLA